MIPFFIGAIIGLAMGITWSLAGRTLSRSPVFTECGDTIYADYEGNTWICSRATATDDSGLYGIPWRLLRGTLPLYTSEPHRVLRHAWQARVLEQRLLVATIGEGR